MGNWLSVLDSTVREDHSTYLNGLIDIALGASIAAKLPHWITQNRLSLGRRLYLAEQVFEHNIRVLTEYHRSAQT